MNLSSNIDQIFIEHYTMKSTDATATLATGSFNVNCSFIPDGYYVCFSYTNALKDSANADDNKTYSLVCQTLTGQQPLCLIELNASFTRNPVFYNKNRTTIQGYHQFDVIDSLGNVISTRDRNISFAIYYFRFKTFLPV